MTHPYPSPADRCHEAAGGVVGASWAGYSTSTLAEHGQIPGDKAGLGPALLRTGWALTGLGAAGQPLESESGAALAAGLTALAAGAALAGHPWMLVQVSELCSKLAAASVVAGDENELAGALLTVGAAARTAASLIEHSPDRMADQAPGPSRDLSPELAGVLALTATAAAELATAAISRRAAPIVSRETSL
jgi:hypothetical protein